MKTRSQMSSDLTTTILANSTSGKLTVEQRGNQILLGKFPEPVLTALAIDDLDVVTSVSVIEKIMTKHALSPGLAANIHSLICAPLAVYASASKGDSIVVVSTTLVGASPLIAAIVVNTPDAFMKGRMHWMTSAYPKDNAAIFAKWEADGLLLWRP
jgi:Phage MuF-C-terminal domain